MPYLNVNEVESALEFVATSFPTIIQRFPLPHPTWESRTCHAVKIANGGGTGRIGTYFLGGIHAREWVCPDSLINFVEQLAEAYQANTGIVLGGKSFTATQIQNIVNKLDIFIFPQANPDGRYRSMATDNLWRKNLRPAPADHPGCEGVDINRNYDFLWNYPVYFNPAAPIVNSIEPGSEIYIGPGSLSEPETRNATFIIENNPNICFFIDVHSYSELILYDWGDDEDQTVDTMMNFQNSAFNGKRGVMGDGVYKEYVNAVDRTLRANLANRMQSAIQAVRGRSYLVEQSCGLYPTAGTSTDYALSRTYIDPYRDRIHAYTIECGTTFQPPDAERQEIIKEVTAALLEFCLGILELPADIYVRDNLQDTGEEPLFSGYISCSPDINHFRQELTDPQATLGSATAKHQDNLFENIEKGQPNYIYVRLQNRGYAVHNAEVDVYWSNPSTLPAPTSWNLIGTIPVPAIAPGEFKVAGPLAWSTMPATGHYCFVAVLGNAQDPKPDLGSIHDINDFYALIRNMNNVTWKNFDVEDIFAGTMQSFNFKIQGWSKISYQGDLEIDISTLPGNAEAELRIIKRLTEGAAGEGLTLKEETVRYRRYSMTDTKAALRNMQLKSGDITEATICITLPDTVPNGAYDFYVLQKIGGQEMGRVTKRLLVGDYPFVANRNSYEVHKANCDWVKKMSPANKAAYREIDLALKHGFNGCRYCLPEYDNG